MANIIHRPSLIIPGGLSWPSKCIVALRGNQSDAGLILMAALDKAASHPPRIVSLGGISRDGRLFALLQNRSGQVNPHDFGPIQTVLDAYRYLADRLKFGDEEVNALFEAIKMWVAEDQRVTEPTKLTINLDEI